MNKQKRQQIIILILEIAMIIGIAVIGLTILYSALYTYPAEDDFSFESAVKDLIRDYGGQWAGAVQGTIRYEKTRQGAYLASFLLHFIVPFTRWGMPGFHVVMFALDVFFFGALWFATKTFLKRKESALFFMLMEMTALFCLKNTLCNIEFFS